MGNPVPAVDIVCLTLINHEINILLVQRKFNPFKGFWATPGGFIEYKETVVGAAQREFFEEVSININDFAFSHYLDAPDRDSRGHVISFVFVTFLYPAEEPKANDDAKKAQWFRLNNMPNLAFDHHSSVRKCFKNLKQNKIDLSVFRLFNTHQELQLSFTDRFCKIQGVDN